MTYLLLMRGEVCAEVGELVMNVAGNMNFELIMLLLLLLIVVVVVEVVMVVVAVVVISNLTNKNDFSLSWKDTATPPLFPIKPRSPVGTLATRTSNTIKQYQTKGRSMVLHFVRSEPKGRERTRRCEWPAWFWRRS